MDTRQSKVAILLPVRNAERFLQDAITSLEAQSFTEWECFAVDDASTDRSLEILKQWIGRDDRVRLLQGGGKGIVNALNLAFALCHTPFIARMDADDLALPDRLRRQLDFLVANESVVACGTGALMVDPKGRPLCPVGVKTDHAGIMESLLQGSGTAIVHPSLMARTDAVKSIGGYREAYRHVEDFDLYLRLSEIGQLANLPEILLHYRQHTASANVSQRTKQKDLRLQALNEYLRTKGLPERNELPFGRAGLESIADIHADWALKAALAGNRATAWVHAFSAFRRQPFLPARSRLLWQVWKLGRRS